MTRQSTTIRCNTCMATYRDEGDLLRMNDPDSGDAMDACPACKTDANLMDLEAGDSDEPTGATQERDALAAHIGEMTEIAQAMFTCLEGGESLSGDEIDQFHRIAERKPATSLARRDARVKAEALEDLARHMETSGYADEASGVRTYAGQA